MKLRNFIACLDQAKRNLQKQCADNGFTVDLLEISENADICLLHEKYLQITYTTDDYQTYIIAEMEGDKLTFIEVEFHEYE